MAETPPLEDPASDLADDDLDDLDALLNDLEQTLDGEASAEEETPKETAGDEHLEEIDNLLEMDDESLEDVLQIATPAAPPSEDAVSSLEDLDEGEDLDFELDALDKVLDDESAALLTPSDASGGDDAMDDLLNDEFDFSDLESMLDEETLEAQSAPEPHIEIEGEQIPIEETATESGTTDRDESLALENEADEDLSDEFDFSDLESMLDDTTEDAEDALEISDSEEITEDLDLGEQLDFSLEGLPDSEAEEVMSLENEEGAQEASDEFDFSDLESLIEEPDDAAESLAVSSETSEGDEAASVVELTPQGLELDQDEEGSAEEEFDLGELDELFGDEEEKVEPDTALEAEDAATSEPEIPELVEDEATDSSTEDDLDILEELEIEPDAQAALADEESPDREEQDIPALAEKDEAFDLGELENVFDMEELTAEAEAAGPEGLGIAAEHQKDLDELEKLLEIDEDDESDDLSTVIEEPRADGDDLQLDLEEIEKTLEAERQKAKAIELETGFDDDTLGLEPAEEPAPDEEEFELELETSDREESASQASPLGDFEIEVEPEVSEATEMAAAAAESASADSFSIGDTDLVEEEEVQRPTPPKPPVTAIPTAPLPARSSSRTPLLLLLLLVILAGAVVLLDRLGIEVPYVNSALKNVPGINALFAPEVPDAGNLKLAARVADSRFVENSAAGRLFVIKGNISNGYDQPRTQIAITGKLFAEAADPVQTQTIVGGNVLADTELGTLSLTEIQQRLNQAPTASVQPARTLPFMIVFSNLPDSLREYTVEVTGSSPAQK